MIRDPLAEQLMEFYVRKLREADNLVVGWHHRPGELAWDIYIDDPAHPGIDIVLTGPEGVDYYLRNGVAP